MLEVVLTCAFAIHIRCTAMQASAKRIGIPQINLDNFHAQFVHLLCLIHFRLFNANCLRIQHQNIHAQPDRGIAQGGWRVMRRLRRINDFPSVVQEHFTLFIWQTTLWIVQDQTRTQWGECCVNVDWIGIAWEIHRVDTVIGEMASVPFDAFQVCGEPVLHHQILAKTQNIGGVK